jgi:serine phosphatase RsbU (regulator of sigma subunit)
VPPALELSIPLSPDAQSPGRARRALRTALRDAGLDPDPDADAGTAADPDLADTAMLLASELCENAVMHAGTDFDFAVAIDASDLTVTVTDRGTGLLERRLALARPVSSRAAPIGRGLLLVERLSSAWGTRHDVDGHHTWFRLPHRGHPTGPVADPATGSTRDPAPPTGTGVASFTTGEFAPAEPSKPAGQPSPWPAAPAAQGLLHLPLRLSDELDPAEDVAEVLRRLCEVIEPRAATVIVDYGDGQGAKVLARTGLESFGKRDAVTSTLPLNAPLRGELTVLPHGQTGPDLQELTDLCAQRIALSIESGWLRGLDNRQRAWMTYLAEASELLGQPREVELTAALVPPLVVPRLGPWCSVHLTTPTGQPRLAALAHIDESQLESLRAALAATDPTDPVSERLAQILDGLGEPTQLDTGALASVAVPLTARGQICGLLMVAYPLSRRHTPEEITVISDLARRVALAISNVQHLAVHKATSVALQRALLPAAVPTARGIEFAADYLPASSASAVGGDFYDVRELSADRQWLTCIGDVCGKGAQAAARTGMVRDMLRVLFREGRSAEEALAAVNDILMQTGDPYQFCTVAAALIDRPVPQERPGLNVSLVLAGHDPLILLRADGSTELTGTVGTALGLLPRIAVTRTTHHIDPGDCLIAYTDGVIEQRDGGRNGQAEQFGFRRLLDTVADAAGRSAPEVVAHIRDTIAGYGQDLQDDDIALLVIRALPSEPSRPVQPRPSPTLGRRSTSIGDQEPPAAAGAAMAG